MSHKADDERVDPQTDTGATPSRQEPIEDAKYEIHIEQASGLAIGDGAQVVHQATERTTQADRVEWNRPALRELLTAAFTDGELTALCYDYFPQLYDEFGEGMGKSTKVHRLLEHCIRQARVETLLGLIRERNPTQYERFGSGRLPDAEVQRVADKHPQGEPKQPIPSDGKRTVVEKLSAFISTLPWKWVGGIGAGVVVVALLASGLGGFFPWIGQPTATLRLPTSTLRLPTSTLRPPTSTPIAVVSRVREKDGAVMVYVPAGEFWMGRDDGDVEKPRHKVYLDAFWIDRTEVTNAQYRKCVEADACSPPEDSKSLTRGSYYGNPEYDDYPVIQVTWYQAREYAKWVSGRLPTEAEWEYAARGPDGNIYPWGNGAPNDSLLNYDGNVGDTTAVGSYPDGASWCGAWDMAGNVFEWTRSLYADYPYDPNDGRENPDAYGRRVFRGGSSLDTQYGAQGTARYGIRPDRDENGIGFRLVVSPISP